MNFTISADYLSCGSRRLFTILLEPEHTPPRGAILYLHPFAEEMHKARRTVAQQARMLAGNGYRVMLLDLSGCGDSSGLLAEASWSGWKEDAVVVLERLRQTDELPVMLWGLRLGALLACDIASDFPDLERLLLWQPVLNGEQHIDQFLRVELAGRVLKGEAGFDRATLWNELRSGRSLVVAGYELSPVLAMGMAHARLGDCMPACRVEWLDVAERPSSKPGVANTNVIERWLEHGVPVSWKSVTGQPFWRNADAGDSPSLMKETLLAVTSK